MQALSGVQEKLGVLAADVVCNNRWGALVSWIKHVLVLHHVVVAVPVDLLVIALCPTRHILEDLTYTLLDSINLLVLITLFPKPIRRLRELGRFSAIQTLRFAHGTDQVVFVNGLT